ncbi:PREDICTED: uncharacterized protein LOC104708836 [Camelina sativa]|uniref:Uncharacterized protein LOC104708836 n=1 Tax=Camelina sativa TaxID=90675 RepID=A0ABM0TBM1_CAMSA|nr:PREDICTED: uncharacterized protein LOC104708836 [Camelina sativa]
MSGKSSARLEKSGKNKTISPVDTAGISNLFAQEGILATKHEILKENHENLLNDYKILEENFKHVNEMNEVMKLHLETPIKELEAKNQRLLDELEKERSETEEYKKEMKRMESEKETLINEMRVKNQELLTAKEKGEEKLKMMVDKYGALKERSSAAESQCSFLKSLFDANNHTSLGGCNDVSFTDEVTVVDDDHNVTGKNEEALAVDNHNNVTLTNEVIVVDDDNVTFKTEVIVVDGHNVNNTAADAIVISDESDAEDDNPTPRKSNIIPQWPVNIKQEPQSDVPNSSKANYVLSPSSSSSSSSSSDEYVSVQLPVKRSRDYYNKVLKTVNTEFEVEVAHS